MAVFNENSDFSIRRFIALSWTMVIIGISIAVAIYPKKFKLPSESFLTPITMTVWAFYFMRQKAKNGAGKIKDKIQSIMGNDSSGMSAKAYPYEVKPPTNKNT